MEITDTIPICIWCDGTWCYPDELSDFSYMSDDYVTRHIAPDVDPEIYVDDIIQTGEV